MAASTTNAVNHLHPRAWDALDGIAEDDAKRAYATVKDILVHMYVISEESVQARIRNELREIATKTKEQSPREKVQRKLYDGVIDSLHLVHEASSEPEKRGDAGVDLYQIDIHADPEWDQRQAEARRQAGIEAKVSAPTDPTGAAIFGVTTPATVVGKPIRAVWDKAEFFKIDPTMVAWKPGAKERSNAEARLRAGPQGTHRNSGAIAPRAIWRLPIQPRGRRFYLGPAITLEPSSPKSPGETAQGPTQGRLPSQLQPSVQQQVGEAQEQRPVEVQHPKPAVAPQESEPQQVQLQMSAVVAQEPKPEEVQTQEATHLEVEDGAEDIIIDDIDSIMDDQAPEEPQESHEGVQEQHQPVVEMPTPVEAMDDVHKHQAPVVDLPLPVDQMDDVQAQIVSAFNLSTPADDMDDVQSSQETEGKKGEAVQSLPAPKPRHVSMVVGVPASQAATLPAPSAAGPQTGVAVTQRADATTIPPQEVPKQMVKPDSSHQSVLPMLRQPQPRVPAPTPTPARAPAPALAPAVPKRCLSLDSASPCEKTDAHILKIIRANAEKGDRKKVPHYFHLEAHEDREFLKYLTGLRFFGNLDGLHETMHSCMTATDSTTLNELIWGWKVEYFKLTMQPKASESTLMTPAVRSELARGIFLRICHNTRPFAFSGAYSTLHPVTKEPLWDFPGMVKKAQEIEATLLNSCNLINSPRMYAMKQGNILKAWEKPEKTKAVIEAIFAQTLLVDLDEPGVSTIGKRKDAVGGHEAPATNTKRARA